MNFFVMPINLELKIIKFYHYERKCYLPIILNFTKALNRIEENKILERLISNLANADGVSKVNLIGGGIDTYEQLSKVFESFMEVNENQKIQFLNFYEKRLEDSTESIYPNSINVKYDSYMSLAVKVINENSMIEEFGNYPLPVILME